MKNTFYRPKEINTQEFDAIINQMHNDLVKISQGHVHEQELKDYLAKLIADQIDLASNLEMGFWGFDDPEKMPSDIRVEYFYIPTYIAAGILMNCKLNFPHVVSEIQGFQEALGKALLASTGRGLQGHGHDAIDGMIKTLNILITAKAHIFIEKYPNECDQFTKLFKDCLEGCRQALITGKTRGDWGEDYAVQYHCVLQPVDPKAYLELEKSLGSKEELLFVYGTLMSNNRQGMTYLDDARFLGLCTLKGYALYDLGAYPGIVKDPRSMVKGELYAISSDKITAIDQYEGEGLLYHRERVEGYNEEHERFKAFVYVYNKSTSGKVKVDYDYQPWFKGVVNQMNDGKYVWYAAYGSNINIERFMRYIQDCTDKTPPLEEKPLILDHPIYFSNNSRRWEGKGVAFLDIEKPGKAYGKMYLITKEQLAQIHQLEGQRSDWYNEIIQIGTEAGLSIKTITHTPRYAADVVPAKGYLTVITQGLTKTYPSLSEKDIDLYLMKTYLNKSMIEVLRYLRKQEHGTAIAKIGLDLSKNQSWITSIIQNLKDLDLVKQDGRSIRAGITWDSSEAIYYTVPNRSEVIDSLISQGFHE